MTFALPIRGGDPRLDAVHGLPHRVTSLYDRIILGTEGLIDYWPLDEFTGPYYDLVGGQHLTLTSGASAPAASLVPSDPYGRSWVGSTISGLLQTAANYVFPPVMSLECWTNPGVTSNNNGLVGAWNGPGAMLTTQASHVLSFFTGSTGLGAAIVDSIGSHIVGTYDGANRCLYVNGALVAGPTIGAAPNGASGFPFQVSGYGGNQFWWTGPIGKVAVYSRDLTSIEAYQHYHAGQF